MRLGNWTFRAFLDGHFRLDGGSMFGVVPRTMWQKHHPPDQDNRIVLALRCLLAEGEDRRVLVDTGIGEDWDEKGRRIYAMERRPRQLLGELEAAGIGRETITDVVLTHLHFDHAGGTVLPGENGPEPAFPRARHWVQRQHWDWAHGPTERDRASFRPGGLRRLADLGLLELIEGSREIAPGVRVAPIHGHTPGQQMVEFHTGEGTVVYCADLIPFASHIHVPWIMGFDLNPLLTLNEKREFLSRAVEEGYILVFEHDPEIEACTVEFSSGRFQVGRKIRLSSATDAESPPRPEPRPEPTA